LVVCGIQVKASLIALVVCDIQVKASTSMRGLEVERSGERSPLGPDTAYETD
jgi:hypothetical protein